MIDPASSLRGIETAETLELKIDFFQVCANFRLFRMDSKALGKIMPVKGSECVFWRKFMNSLLSSESQFISFVYLIINIGYNIIMPGGRLHPQDLKCEPNSHTGRYH